MVWLVVGSAVGMAVVGWVCFVAKLLEKEVDLKDLFGFSHYPEAEPVEVHDETEA